MPKMTLSIPNELMVRLRTNYPQIKWSEVARAAILDKVEKLEKLQHKGEL